MHDLIIIGGPSGVGKTTVARQLAARLPGCTPLSQDCFCADRSHLLVDHDFYTLDHEQPEIIDHSLAADSIHRLRSAQPVDVPVYLHSQLRRSGQQTLPAGHVIYEGLHALYDDELVQSAVLRVFLDAPEPVTYQRRRLRDLHDRGGDPARYEHYFHHFVLPGFERHVRPLMHKANLVVDACLAPDEIVERILGSLKP